MEVKQIEGIINAECTHAGQWGAYGDSEYTYNIMTEGGKEIPEEDLLPYCFSLVGRSSIQTRREWQEAHGDAGKYFAGYYELSKQPYGYYFKYVSPYTD